MKRGLNSKLKFFSVCIIALTYSKQLISQQPRPVPTAYPSNIPVNLIRTWDATAPQQDPNNMMTGALKDVKQVTQYFDGLGRSIQTVIKKGSLATEPTNPTSSTTAVDMVSPVEYDEFGREQFKYLPFAANNTGGYVTNDGKFKFNPFQQQATFMSAQFGSQNETFFYGKTSFESSPLNKITDNYAPGNSWIGSEILSDPLLHRSTKIKCSVNTMTDDVKIWCLGVDLAIYVLNNGNGTQDVKYGWTALPPNVVTVLYLYRQSGSTGNWAIWGANGGINPYTITIPVGTYEYALQLFYADGSNTIEYTNNLYSTSYFINGAYSPGQLFKTIVTDENNKQVIEFKDKEGKIILKKVQVTASGDDGTGSGYSGWSCTFYIYDDFNNLRCVIQPNAIAAMATANNWNLSAITLSELCFRYEYDQRNHIIKKQTPGALPVSMVYDALDRLVLTQDGNLAAQGKWMYTQYDNLNRPIATGLWPSSLTQSQHAANAANSSSYPLLSNEEELTRTFYDNYTWLNNYSNPLPSTYNTSYDTYFLSTSNTVWPYPQANIQSSQLKSIATGSRIKVLGTSSTYLYSVNFYDEKGKVIQTQNTNVTGGIDVTTIQYNWGGQPLITVQKQNKQGNTAQTHIVITKFQYDDLGRVLNVKKAINTTINTSPVTTINKPEQLIVQHEYDQLGQLKKKTLGNNNLENLTYDYNIRGWMLGMNRSYAKDATSNNYFGFDLGYDKANNNIIGNQSYNNPQYNGNIEGMVWKSKGDGEKRKYDFTYDAANRLMKGDFTQYTGSVFDQSAGLNYDIKMGDGTNVSSAYDDNGNIKRMQQWGWKLTGSINIDDLHYDYRTNSNQLAKVTDWVTADNKLGDFKDGTNSNDDYSYDVNGNLTLDNNKTISSITYNHLNLPVVISVTGKGTIAYTYDATGNKITKLITDNSTAGKTITTTTTYINGFVYESKTTTPANTPNDDYSDKLLFMGHEEGRIRFKPAKGNTEASFEYDYMIKDHLDNVRMVLTEEQKQDNYPAATLEDVTYNGGTAISVEAQYYNIDNSKTVPQSVATGIPAYQNNNGITNNNPYSNTGVNSEKLYQLNATNNTVQDKNGLGIVLKVMAGDAISIFGKSYHKKPAGGYTSSTNPLSVIDLMNLLAASPAASPKAITGSQISNLPGFPTSVTSLLNNQPAQTSDMPRASINWVILDEQFKYVSGGFDMVGTATNTNGTFKDHAITGSITISKNGYIYVFCSNESQYNVFFDNLQVIHDRGPILEETHYYPFGLTMAGISSKAVGFIPNSYQFNGGNELQSAEFSDRSGLDLYDATNRMFDPQLGRFWQIDELAEANWEWTPYNFGLNNPISFNDPLGLKAENPYDLKENPHNPKDPDKPPVFVTMQEVIVVAHVKPLTREQVQEFYWRLRDAGISIEKVKMDKYRRQLEIHDRVVKFMERVHAQQREEEKAFLEVASWFFPVGQVTKLRYLKYVGNLFNFKRGTATTRVFWSGGRAVAGNAAMNFAKVNGMKTLEMTFKGKVLEGLTNITSYKITKPLWKMASASFARGVKEEAHFFTTPLGANSASLWLNVEKPILEKKGINIITHIIQ